MVAFLGRYGSPGNRAIKRFCIGLAGQSFPVQSHLH
jgi:hypothetical protein